MILYLSDGPDDFAGIVNIGDYCAVCIRISAIVDVRQRSRAVDKSLKNSILRAIPNDLVTVVNTIRDTARWQNKGLKHSCGINEIDGASRPS